MEIVNCRRKNSSSGDKFSFPIIIQDSDEFEFGSVTSPNSPADHLFSNGKLLPHAFPITHTAASSVSYSYSRSASRTSSKDSPMWSRSTSTNSSSRNSTSTCSSARTSTSTSEASERRRERTLIRPAVSSCQYQYGSSRRWQLIAAVPVLKHQGSRSRKVDSTSVLDRKGSKKSRGVVGEEESKASNSKSWFGKKLFKSFVSTCQECHAIRT